jgi:hypothetical protein
MTRSGDDQRDEHLNYTVASVRLRRSLKSTLCSMYCSVLRPWTPLFSGCLSYHKPDTVPQEDESRWETRIRPRMQIRPVACATQVACMGLDPCSEENVAILPSRRYSASSRSCTLGFCLDVGAETVCNETIARLCLPPVRIP